MLFFDHLEYVPFDYPVARWRIDLVYLNRVRNDFDLNIALAMIENEHSVKNSLFEYRLLLLATSPNPTIEECLSLGWYIRDRTYTPTELAAASRALLYVIHGWVINADYPASEGWVSHPHYDVSYNRRYPNLIKIEDNIYDGMGQQYYTNLQRRKSIFECDYGYGITAADTLTVNTVQYYSDAHRRLPIHINHNGILRQDPPGEYAKDEIIFTDKSTVKEIASLANRVITSPNNAWPRIGSPSAQIKRSGVVVPQRIKAAVKRAVYSAPQMPQRLGTIKPLPVHINHTELPYYEVAWVDVGVHPLGMKLTPNSTHTKFTLDAVQDYVIPEIH